MWFVIEDWGNALINIDQWQLQKCYGWFKVESDATFKLKKWEPMVFKKECKAREKVWER